MSCAMKCDRCGKYYDYYFEREVNGENVRSQNSIFYTLKINTAIWTKRNTMTFVRSAWRS